MITRAFSVCFEGIEPQLVEIECAISPGLPAFSVIGLPDKAVSEARDRIRSALGALSIALPSRRITINLSPADMPKEGSHLDLPIALALLAALNIITHEDSEGALAIGELSLDGRLQPVVGALPAALKAAELGKDLYCPETSGAEAAWVDATRVFATKSLMAIIQHLTGQAPREPAVARQITPQKSMLDMAEVRGQERAKRALEIAAAGRHHVFLVGPPGSGKSMMAARMAGILPPLNAMEALETSMIQSVAGFLGSDGIQSTRPFRERHHTASMAAIVGGGKGAKPGEISLAHNGILFLDELPEFPRHVLETLRQPLETGEVMISRANAHVKYPCKFSLIAAANPCKCGFMTDPDQACGRAPNCGNDYLGRISGPLMDRFDLRIEVPVVRFQDLSLPASGERSHVIAKRVLEARALQDTRFSKTEIATNSDLKGDAMDRLIKMDEDAKTYLEQAAIKLNLTARGFHRVIRVSRTIADLEQSENVARHHVGEAISFRNSANAA
jgi:magnesium chelatase family protein